LTLDKIRKVWYNSKVVKSKKREKKVKNNFKIFIIAVLFVMLVSLACGSSTPTAIQKPVETENFTVPTTDTSAITQPLEPTVTLPTSIPTEVLNPNLINGGTYIVNVDIQPGIYKGLAGNDMLDSCYWERSKDLTGSLDSIISNSNSVGQFYLEVKNTDYALNTSCQLIRIDPIPEHTGEYSKILSAGTYLIGSDIQPGTYKGKAGTEITDSCYWERSRDVGGDLESILANGNEIGQFYVQVLQTDFALKTACELEWTGK
jgi:hypothetical protein